MKEFRKKVWIDPFQTGLLIRIAAYLLVYQVAVWAFMGCYEQIHRIFGAMGADPNYLESGLVRMLLVLVILAPPLVFDALRFAHRLVGPLYRIRKTVQAIAAGEAVAPVELRQGDLLVDFKDDFNRMLKKLEEQGLVTLQAPAKAASAAVPAAAPSLGALNVAFPTREATAK